MTPVWKLVQTQDRKWFSEQDEGYMTQPQPRHKRSAIKKSGNIEKKDCKGNQDEPIVLFERYKVSGGREYDKEMYDKYEEGREVKFDKRSRF